MRKMIRCAFFVVLLCAPFLLPASGQDAPETPEAPARPFLLLELENKIIGPVTADYIEDGIAKARAESYQGVIVKAILNAPVPVVVYVAPGGSRAGSAGVFITLAAHVAAMAPSTNIGAAHPVMMGDGPKGEQPLQKAIEDLTDALRDQQDAPKKEAAPKEEEGEDDEASTSPMQDKRPSASR